MARASTQTYIGFNTLRVAGDASVIVGTGSATSQRGATVYAADLSVKGVLKGRAHGGGVVGGRRRRGHRGRRERWRRPAVWARHARAARPPRRGARDEGVTVRLHSLRRSERRDRILSVGISELILWLRLSMSMSCYSTYAASLDKLVDILVGLPKLVADELVSMPATLSLNDAWEALRARHTTQAGQDKCEPKAVGWYGGQGMTRTEGILSPAWTGGLDTTGAGVAGTVAVWC